MDNYEFNFKNKLGDVIKNKTSLDKITIKDIIDLYLIRCKEAKELYDSGNTIHFAFENKICDIINKVAKDNFKGKLDSSDIIEEFNLGESKIKAEMINYLKWNKDLYYDCNFLSDKEFDFDSPYLKISLNNISSNSFEKRKNVPDILIDKNFNVFSCFPLTLIASDMGNHFFQDKKFDPIINNDVINNISKEIKNNKEELTKLKEKSLKEKGAVKVIQTNKRKQQLLKYINNNTILLDNGYTLKFKLKDDKVFDNQQFDLNNIIMDIYDENLNKVKHLNGVDENRDKNILKYINSTSSAMNFIRSINNKNINQQIKENTKKEKEIKYNERIQKEIQEEKEKEIKYEKERKELENERQKNFENYKETNKKIRQKYGKNDYNKIDVPTDFFVFNENKEKHINEKYKDDLKYFDLSNTIFDDVSVKNTDFRDTNARINPQTVLYKDLSGCNFSVTEENYKNYLPYMWDLTGVKLYNTDLSYPEEKPLVPDIYFEFDDTIFKSYMNENTKLPLSVMKRIKEHEESKKILDNYKIQKKFEDKKAIIFDQIDVALKEGLITPDELISYIENSNYKSNDNSNNNAKHL